MCDKKWLKFIWYWKFIKNSNKPSLTDKKASIWNSDNLLSIIYFWDFWMARKYSSFKNCFVLVWFVGSFDEIWCKILLYAVLHSILLIINVREFRCGTILLSSDVISVWFRKLKKNSRKIRNFEPWNP